MFPIPVLSPIIYKYLIGAAIIAGLVFGIYMKGVSVGKDKVQKEWDDEKIVIKKTIDDLKTKQGEVTIKTVTTFVDRVQIVTKWKDKIPDVVSTGIKPDDAKSCTITPNIVTVHNKLAKGLTQ